MGDVEANKGKIMPGQLKGGAAFRVKDTDKAHFLACINAFAQHLGLKLASAQSPTWLDGRSFVYIWYRSDDGSLLNVTDITMAGKFRVLFYDQEGGKGAAAARSAFSSFVEGMTDFERVEVYPEVPDLK